MRSIVCVAGKSEGFMNIAPDFTITDGWQMLDFLIRIPAKLLAWMLQNSTLAQATELGSFNGDGLGGS